MLLCTTMVMGLLPLSMHLCCEERCCEVTVHKASCCATSDHEKPAIPDDDCCQDQSFFNLAPVFAPVKIGFELQLQDEKTPELFRTLVQSEVRPCSATAYFAKPPTPERLRIQLAHRVLII